MKVYIAIVNDHHCDPQAYAFSTPEKAVEYVQQMAATYWRHHLEETVVKGWIYSITHGEDSAHVIEQDLDIAP